MACEQLVQGRAQAVDICLLCRLRLAILFWGGVAGGAERAGILGLSWLEVACNAKVDQLWLTLQVDHDVAWLKVSIDNRRYLTVKVPKHIADALGPVDDGIFEKWFALSFFMEHVVQVVPLHVLHDQIVIEAFAEVVGDSNDVPVFQIAQDLHLAFKESLSLVPIFFTIEVVAQLLHDTISAL